MFKYDIRDTIIKLHIIVVVYLELILKSKYDGITLLSTNKANSGERKEEDKTNKYILRDLLSCLLKTLHRMFIFHVLQPKIHIFLEFLSAFFISTFFY